MWFINDPVKSIWSVNLRFSCPSAPCCVTLTPTTRWCQRLLAFTRRTRSSTTTWRGSGPGSTPCDPRAPRRRPWQRRIMYLVLCLGHLIVMFYCNMTNCMMTHINTHPSSASSSLCFRIWLNYLSWALMKSKKTMKNSHQIPALMIQR